MSAAHGVESGGAAVSSPRAVVYSRLAGLIDDILSRATEASAVSSRAETAEALETFASLALYAEEPVLASVGRTVAGFVWAKVKAVDAAAEEPLGEAANLSDQALIELLTHIRAECLAMADGKKSGLRSALSCLAVLRGAQQPEQGYLPVAISLPGEWRPALDTTEDDFRARIHQASAEVSANALRWVMAHDVSTVIESTKRLKPLLVALENRNIYQSLQVFFAAALACLDAVEASKGLLPIAYVKRLGGYVSKGVMSLKTPEAQTVSPLLVSGLLHAVAISRAGTSSRVRVLQERLNLKRYTPKRSRDLAVDLKCLATVRAAVEDGGALEQGKDALTAYIESSRTNFPVAAKIATALRDGLDTHFPEIGPPLAVSVDRAVVAMALTLECEGKIEFSVEMLNALQALSSPTVSPDDRERFRDLVSRSISEQSDDAVVASAREVQRAIAQFEAADRGADQSKSGGSPLDRAMCHLDALSATASILGIEAVDRLFERLSGLYGAGQLKVEDVANAVALLERYCTCVVDLDVVGRDEALRQINTRLPRHVQAHTEAVAGETSSEDGVVADRDIAIDVDLIEVLVEEFESFRGEMGELIELAAAGALDLEGTKVLRRHFHTLKGSTATVAKAEASGAGALVADRPFLSVIAYKVEQALNACIAHDRAPTLAIADLAQTVFSRFIEALPALRTGQSVPITWRDVEAAAPAAIRSVEEPEVIATEPVDSVVEQATENEAIPDASTEAAGEVTLEAVVVPDIVLDVSAQSSDVQVMEDAISVDTALDPIPELNSPPSLDHEQGASKTEEDLPASIGDEPRSEFAAASDDSVTDASALTEVPTHLTPSDDPLSIDALIQGDCSDPSVEASPDAQRVLEGHEGLDATEDSASPTSIEDLQSDIHYGGPGDDAHANTLAAAEIATPPQPQEASDSTAAPVFVWGVNVERWLYDAFSGDVAKFLEPLEYHHPDTLRRGEVTHEMLRACHTIASLGKSCGLMPLYDVGHVLEDWVTDKYRTKRLACPDEAEAAMRLMAKLRAMVLDALATNQAAPDYMDAISSFLATALPVPCESQVIRAGQDPAGAEQAAALSAPSIAESSRLVVSEAIVGIPLAAESGVMTVPRQDGESDIGVSGDPPEAILDVAREQPVQPVPEETGTSERAAFERMLNGSFDVPEDISDQIDHDIFGSIFADEVAQIIPEAKQCLPALITTGAEAEAAKNAFEREIHTLKGAARMAGAMRLGAMLHGIEDALFLVGRGVDLPLSDTDVGRLGLALDAVSHAVDRNGVYESPLTMPALGVPSSDSAPATMEMNAAAESAPLSVALPVVADRDKVTASGAESRAAAITRSTPPSQGAVVQTRKKSIRIDAETLAEVVSLADQLLVLENGAARTQDALVSAHRDMRASLSLLEGLIRDLEVEADAQVQSSRMSMESESAFDPLQLDRYTRLQEVTKMLAECVQDAQFASSAVGGAARDLSSAEVIRQRTSGSLRRAVATTLLVPLSTVQDRLSRIVRQAGQETGKLAEFSLVGDIQIHSVVLDKLMQAFEHLLRNSVAHGIEPPEQRTRAGKPATGRIELVCSQAGNELLLVLRDDGAGIAVERIREKAIQKGLLDASVTDDAKIIDVIFRPGFSTADSVTQLAGRGVGMDVVRTALVDLGGDITATTDPGRGASFAMRLPTDMSVISAIEVSVGRLTVMVPVSVIDRVANLLLSDRDGAHVVLEGERYAMHSLMSLLGHARPAEDEESEQGLLVMRGTSRLAIRVEAVGVKRRTVLKPISRHLVGLPGLLGMTVSDVGEAIMVVNPVALVQAYGDAATSAPIDSRATRQADEARKRKLQVMVVDDSLTVRRVTARLLESLDIDVRLCKDGLDAITQVQEDGLPDAILLDLEMPRMNGFEFAEALREHERGIFASSGKLVHTPVIMITSRARSEYQQKAEESGVDDFMTKPYQEITLLSRISSLTGHPLGDAQREAAMSQATA